MKQAPTAPSALVIFGVTGNLSQHMLLPALYHLERERLLPEQFHIIGIFRRDVTVPQLFEAAIPEIESNGQQLEQSVLDRLLARIHSVHMDSTESDHYDRLTAKLAELDESSGVMLNHLFYLAVPPNIFKTVIGNLAQVGLNKPGGERASRLLIEKPFGDDLKSAQELIGFVSEHFQEEQIFRIDHFLAKETAQNILTFRLNNPLIESIWNRQFIDHLEITVAEQIDIQGRAAFYESMGALRDVMQNHLMQLLALVMMEYPQDMTAQSIHDEKQRLFDSITPIDPHQTDAVAVRGQYEGYRNEAGNPDSNVETFSAIKLTVKNSRWEGVPVLLRTGKALATKTTEIVVVFKDRTNRNLDDNRLVIRIQPNEGISLHLLAKKPGFNGDLQPVNMDFSYSNSFDGHQPAAYQRVLVDAMRGDRSLFASSDEVLSSWRILQPLLDAWESSTEAPLPYAKGSWGPAAADDLAARSGAQWNNAA